MKITFRFILILPLVIILFLGFTPTSKADWNGLDTLKIFHDEWEMIYDLWEWNGKLLVNTGPTGLWMMELDENEELQFVDSTIIGDTYSYIRFLDRDTLYTRVDTLIAKTVLIESGFGSTVYLNSCGYAWDLCFDGSRYFGIGGDYWIHKLEIENNTFISIDSFQVADITDTCYFENTQLDNGIASFVLLGPYYEERTAYFYDITGDGFQLLDTLECNRYDREPPIVYDNRIFFAERSSLSIRVKKMNPYNHEIEEELVLDSYLYIDEFFRDDNKIILKTLNRVVIIDLETFELIGSYSISFMSEYENHYTIHYQNDYIVNTKAYGADDDRAIIDIYRIENESECTQVFTRYPNNWAPIQIIQDSDITYIANRNLGLRIVQNIGDQDYEILGDLHIENFIYIVGINGYHLFVGGDRNGRFYDCTDPANLVELNTRDVIPYSIKAYEDCFIFRTSEAIEIYSCDGSSLYSIIEFEYYNGQSFEVENGYLYLQDNSIKTYDLSDIESPALISELPVSAITRDIHIDGDSLFICPGLGNMGLSIYSLVNPELPEFVTNVTTYNDDLPYQPQRELYRYNDVYMTCPAGSFFPMEVMILEPEGVNLLGFINNDYRTTFIPGKNGNIFLNYERGNRPGFYVCCENEFSSIDDLSPAAIPADLTYTIYPNPANAAASISFNLDHSGEVGFALYNVLGQQVFWTSQVYPQGNHTYSLAGNVAALASGTYYLGVTVGGHETVKKLTILK